MARIEGFLQQSHGQMMMAMSTVFDLLAEAYPEAAISLQKKLEERQEASRLEMEAQQALVRAEADSALKEAREEEEAKAMDELADGYGKVLQFPSNSPADLMGCDPAPEVI
jgi:hypothetical protein